MVARKSAFWSNLIDLDSGRLVWEVSSLSGHNTQGTSGESNASKWRHTIFLATCSFLWHNQKVQNPCRELPYISTGSISSPKCLTNVRSVRTRGMEPPITSGVQNSYSFHLLQRSRHFSVYCGPLKAYHLLRGVILHCPTSHSPSTQTQSHYLAQLVEQRAQSQNRRNYNRRKTPEHISMHHPVVFPETSKVSTLNARSF